MDNSPALVDRLRATLAAHPRYHAVPVDAEDVEAVIAELTHEELLRRSAPALASTTYTRSYASLAFDMLVRFDDHGRPIVPTAEEIERLSATLAGRLPHAPDVRPVTVAAWQSSHREIL